MEPGSAPTLTLYGRDGCHLCEVTRAALDSIMASRAAASLPTADIVEVDITTDEELHRAFVATIPVVDLGGRRIELATSPARLQQLVAEVLDGVDGPLGLVTA